MKLFIFTFAVNDKFPIDIQYKQFKKYLQDDFEFIIFNDAFDTNTVHSIDKIAQNINVKCVRVPQKIHKDNQNPSEAYAETLNWASRVYALNDDHDTILLVHTDIFPIRTVSVLDILGSHQIASVMESRPFLNTSIEYIYPTFTILKISELKDKIHQLDFAGGKINAVASNSENNNTYSRDASNIYYYTDNLNYNELVMGLDTGAMTGYFIKRYPETIKYLDQLQVRDVFNKEITDENAEKFKYTSLISFFESNNEICTQYGLSPGWITNGFYHYIAGSQWNSRNNLVFQQGHNLRGELFKKYF